MHSGSNIHSEIPRHVVASDGRAHMNEYFLKEFTRIGRIIIVESTLNEKAS